MSWLSPNKVPQDVFQAFSNLEKDISFGKIIAWLEKARDEETGMYPGIADDVPLRWNQGRCQALDTILTTNKTAQEMLLRLQKPSR